MNETLHSEEETKEYAFVFWLAVLTIVASTLEGSFSVYYGYSGKSLTLFGNGIASFIEVISGFGIAGMTMRMKKQSDQDPDSFERTALRITGTGLYILAVGLVVVSIANMIAHRHPETTFSGIVIAIVTIIAIGSLTFSKFKVAKQVQSNALFADAKSTRICVYMSTMVLVASVIYELTSFEYADSIGALGLGYFAFTEARVCFAFR